VAAGQLAAAEPSVTSTEAAVTWATGEPAATATWATGEPAAVTWATGEPAAGPERLPWEWPTNDRRYW